jgi:hypothetical protein
MKSGLSLNLLPGALLCLVVLYSQPAYAVELDAEETGGWTQNYIEKQEDEWLELDANLPPYPEEKNLLDLKIGTDGMQYAVKLDKPSLVRGKDGVVRYTVVLVPPSGLWNVSNEGLRCGEKVYRRYAYGIDGKWQPLENSPWQEVRGSGANRYRRILYFDFFCNPMKPEQTVQEMINSFSENWHEM